ncbi:hypothetical protein IPH19_00830 [Candidatus Uhrbacteria bacterium]|nr:MAG: hypothetical protein IPH19_00830 [Candidatus Uhrbacteria bacterium]
MATALAMCAPGGMEMMGDAMVDAGHMLSDAADDATSDAAAQESCATNCSTGGVLRVMTADTDPAQLVTATVIHDGTGSSESFEVVAGPLVLTDLGFARDGVPHLEFRVSSLPDCPFGPSVTDAPPFTVIALDDQSATSVNTRYNHEIHGGRYYIPEGSRLCAYLAGDTTWYVRYAGFRPYN